MTYCYCQFCFYFSLLKTVTVNLLFGALAIWGCQQTKPVDIINNDCFIKKNGQNHYKFCKTYVPVKILSKYHSIE